MDFTFTQHDGFVVITFTLADGNATPDMLQAIDLGNLDFGQGFIISGRGPVWLFATLTHLLHPSQWVATHDPRLGGGVVTQSHIGDVAVGDVIKF